MQSRKHNKTYLFSKYWLSTYYVPRRVRGPQAVKSKTHMILNPVKVHLSHFLRTHDLLWICTTDAMLLIASDLLRTQHLVSFVVVKSNNWFFGLMASNFGVLFKKTFYMTRSQESSMFSSVAYHLILPSTIGV